MATKINMKNDIYINGLEIEKYLKRPYHKERIRLAINLMKEVKSSGKVLELGSGTGIIAKQIKDEGFNVIATDIEEKVLISARNKGLLVKCFDCEKTFPFDDKTFDIIFAADIIEHLYDGEFFLNECYRVLKEDGLLILTTPNLATLQDRFKFFFGVSPRQINPLHRYIKTHIRQFTYKMMKDTLLSCNFIIEKHTSNLVSIDISKKTHIDFYSIAKFFPNIGGSIILRASKKINKLNMEKYEGIIPEEYLKNKDILINVEIKKQSQEKGLTVNFVLITKEDILRINKFMVDKTNYCYFWNEEEVIIVFKKKIFKINKKEADFRVINKYAKSMGVNDFSIKFLE